MESNYLVRNLHIGEIISRVIFEKEMTKNDIKLKMGISSKKIEKMLKSKTLDAKDLLTWSKVLRYDFFRLYSSHLMLHHGISITLTNKKDPSNIKGIRIRKNVYTNELIEYLTDKVRNKEMTSMQVINKFAIPKTTFYKWLQKYPIKNEIVS